MNPYDGNDKRRFRRPLRATIYGAQAVAGLCFTLYPLRTALEAIAQAYTYGAGFLLAVGGILALSGILIRRRAGELVGLPLCCIASATLAVVLLSQWQNLAAIGLGFIFVAFTFWMLDRWTFVQYASEVSRRERARA